MRTNHLLAIIVVLQILLLAGQWFGGAVPQANAQIPDSGAQRNQIIDELKSSNDKLDKLISILDGGNLQVKIAKPDDNKGG